ncbi:MAG TPA: transposase [Kofleriaceae bacterium]|nr:transposase [Kofleriaceae bacterium]
MGEGRGKRGQVEMVFRRHGGKRPGAGRKPKGVRPGASHAARPEHNPRHPVHVTIRVVGSASGLRRKDIYLALREATIVTARREDFRMVHMSIQHDHIHLIVEADSKAALSKGVRGFSISAARQITKAITARGGDRRPGRVIGDRFHARPLTTPRAVRNALAYDPSSSPANRSPRAAEAERRRARRPRRTGPEPAPPEPEPPAPDAVAL